LPKEKRQFLHRNAVAMRFVRARNTKVGASAPGCVIQPFNPARIAAGGWLYTRPEPKTSSLRTYYRLPKNTASTSRTWQRKLPVNQLGPTECVCYQKSVVQARSSSFLYVRLSSLT